MATCGQASAVAGDRSPSSDATSVPVGDQGPVDQCDEYHQRRGVGVGRPPGQDAAEVLDGHPDERKHRHGQHHGELGDLRGHEHADGHDEADDGQQDRHRRSVVEEERLGGPVDMGEPARLTGVQAGDEVVERLRRPAGAHHRQDGQEYPHDGPDRLGRPHPDGPGRDERPVRALARPEQDGQDGVEEHAARTTTEWGGTAREDGAQALAEPPDGDGPDDGEGQSRLAACAG